MINLIPEQQKKEIQKEYYMHGVYYALILIAMLALAGCVILAPSYILSLSKRNAAQFEITSLKQGETFALAQELKNTIQTINEKLSIFPKKPVLSSVVSEVVYEVEKVLPQGITLVSIRILSDVEKTRTVEVSGTSNTRDTLLSFVKKLETTERFSNVVLPVSSYAKGTNIPFTVSFTQK
jgi:hypothetical protein